MHTVLSAFSDRAAATRAVDRLVQAGFPREDIHLQHRDVHPAGMTAGDWDGMEREIAMDRSVLDSIGHFFASLFGEDNHRSHVDTYSELVRRGECIVVLDAEDDLRAQRAAALLDGEGGRDRNIVPRSNRPIREMAEWKVEV